MTWEMAEPNDIRRFFTSPPRNASSQPVPAAGTPERSAAAPNHQTPLQRTWRANRRIVESDSDGADPEVQGNHDAGAAEDLHTPPSDENGGRAATDQPHGSCDEPLEMTPARGGANAALAQPADATAAIEISESDADDDIWIRPPAARRTSAQEQRAPTTSTAESGRTRQGRVSPVRQTRNTRRRYEAAAEESSTDSSSDNSDNWMCVESDTDAEDLYRSAVAGVRNARASRQQLRRSTNTCPVCAKFASFLQHFI